MKVTDQELDKLLKVLSPTGTDYQAGRIVRLLAQGPNRTGIIASRCSVGNIPDVIAKSINPKIMPLGFFVSCVKPPMVIRNQFGQVAGDWIYTLYRADKAANDNNQGSSEDDWAKTYVLDTAINNVFFKAQSMIPRAYYDVLKMEED